MKNNDDPIQEVGGKNPFSKLKSFENDLEYKFEKEMEEFEKYLDEEKLKETNNLNDTENSDFGSYSPRRQINYTKSKSSSISSYISYFIFLGFIIGFFCIFVFAMSENNRGAVVVSDSSVVSNENHESVELDKDDNIYNNLVMSKLEFISFDNAGKIPALYKFDTTTEAIDCKFTESDPRYKDSANTLEISYFSIPEESLEELKQNLLRRKYTYLGNSLDGEIYVLETENGYFLFVVISKANIIYGCGSGNYNYILDLEY